MNTTYFKNLVAGNIFRTQTTPAIPTSYYLGLSSTLPNLSGGNVTEPSAGKGYSRVDIAASLGAPSGGSVKNKTAVYFSEATDDWGDIPYYVLYDAASGGNLLKYGGLSRAMTVSANSTVWFDVGDISFPVLDE